MVRAGLAVVYENAGAEYGGLKEKLIAAEKIARASRKCMWKQENFVHPSDYKRNRIAENAASLMSVQKETAVKA
jgi:endonuclease YncB( thermonuclease family)